MQRRIWNSFLLIFIVLAMLFSLSAPAAKADSGPGDLSAVIAKYRGLIPQEMEKQRIPGFSLALVTGTQVLWAEGFGYTDWDRRTPVTVDTPFSIQSMSKSFTAVAVLLAQKEGLVDLDTPIDRYLPDFHVNSIFEEHPESVITLRHLLSHTAGFTHEAPLGNNFTAPVASFADHIASISSTWLKFPVGASYAYSNLGIDLAAYVVQVRAGMPFQQYVKEHLLDPLGMSHSSLDLPTIQADPGRAIGHTLFLTDLPLIPMMPSGGVYASAADMARYVQFHINRGALGDTRLLTQAELDPMYKPNFVASSWQNYGLGIGTGRNHGADRLSHGGGGFGFLSMMTWYPQLDLGLVWLSNSADHDLQGWLADQILDDVIYSNSSYYFERSQQGASIPVRIFTPQDVWPLNEAGLDAKIQALALPADLTAAARQAQAIGMYGVPMLGHVIELVQVNQRQGQLYWGEERLTEVQPNLYFTPSGEALDLRTPTATWRNIQLEKVEPLTLISLVAVLGICALVFLARLVWGLVGLFRRKREPGALRKAARLLLVFASLVGLFMLAGLVVYPILLFGGLPLPTPNLPLWQQAFFLLPYAMLVLALAAAALLILDARRARPLLRARLFDALTLAALVLFILVVLI